MTSPTSELRAVLAEERAAIRSLDAIAVERAAATKERLIAEIGAADEGEREPMLRELRLLREDLRRNLVLLAHARDCMRDAITRATPKGTAPGARLSIDL